MSRNMVIACISAAVLISKSRKNRDGTSDVISAKPDKNNRPRFGAPFILDVAVRSKCLALPEYANGNSKKMK